MNTRTIPSVQTVLVMDDDEICRALAEQQLVAQGCTTVLMAEDGVHGLRLLQTLARAPDLLVCDIFMPEKDGIELVMDLCELHYRGGLILLSGGGRDMLDAAAQIAQVNGLQVLGAFQKPLSDQDLAQALRQLQTPD